MQQPSREERRQRGKKIPRHLFREKLRLHAAWNMSGPFISGKVTVKANDSK